MMRKKMQINKGILYVSVQLLISAVLLILSLQLSRFNMSLFYVTFTLAIISMVTYYHFKRKRNYLDFDTIFISISYLICFFSTFFYNQPYYRALFLGFSFNESYINYATIVALMGFQAYFIGSLSRKSNIVSRPPLVVVDTKILSVCITIGCAMFIMLGGLNYYQSIYADSQQTSSSYVVHILLFICIFAIVLVATEFYNKQIKSTYRPAKMSIIVLCALSLLLMFVGNRTMASQILLPIIVLYTTFQRRVKIREFIVFLTVGIVVMWLFQNVRSNNTIDLSSQNVVLVLSDLTIPSRANFAAAEYVDNNGYTFGENMLGGVVGIIPFMASSLDLDMNKLSSAELLTKDAHETLNTPESAQVGLGTTIIADIYLSFGVIGVFLLMFILGYYISTLQRNVLLLDYYSIIIYSAFVANSVFVARASYTHPLRYIILCFGVAIIIRNILLRRLRFLATRNS